MRGDLLLNRLNLIKILLITGLDMFLIVIEQPHVLKRGKCLLDVKEKLLRRTIKPDAGTEFCAICETDLESTPFAIADFC